MNMFARQRIKSPEYHHMICIGKTKCTSEKGLLLRHFGLANTLLLADLVLQLSVFLEYCITFFF